MVLVTSKTSAGRTAIGALTPGGGGGEGGIVRWLSQAQDARHRNSGPTSPEGNKATRRTLLACVASTPEAVAGRRACTWHQLAGWCHVAFLGSVSARRPSCGWRRRCAAASSLLFLRLSDVGERAQAAARTTTSGTVRAVTSSDATGSG